MSRFFSYEWVVIYVEWWWWVVSSELLIISSSEVGVEVGVVGGRLFWFNSV